MPSMFDLKRKRKEEEKNSCCVIQNELKGKRGVKKLQASCFLLLKAQGSAM